MSKENRAFDTQTFGTGYGFESQPRRAVEMPPTWVLIVGLGFLLLAMGFWVCRTRIYSNAHATYGYMFSST
jgi:dolichyl-phosphate beta-glucosyltransferase